MRHSDQAAGRGKVDVLPAAVRRHPRSCQVGYFFPAEARDALRRNRAREGRERVPDVARFATRKRLVPPSYDEGFDRLFVATLDEVSGSFVVTPQPRPADTRKSAVTWTADVRYNRVQGGTLACERSFRLLQSC
jgi:hypothetical protein